MAYAFAPLPLPIPCSTSEEPPEHEVSVGVKEKEGVHKTKTVSFLGRTTPIVLQNDNGPCPLLAICNVLLLKNRLHLSPEISEVSQEKLLSLIADRLIDSNSNDTCAEYVESRLKNIADAIDLLPRLATGIDVNIKFKRIDDFEFTTECAIFHLLDIPLYHGWIVDPQDYDTAQAIGYKSYNALMGELVALETQNVGDESNNTAEEAAAATPTLGVPSPCLSKATSFNDSLRAVSDQPNARKGDLEEEAELLRALKLSESEFPRSVGDSLVETDIRGAMDLDPTDIPERISADNCHSSLSNDIDNLTLIANLPEKMTCSSSKTDGSYSLDQSTFTESGEHFSGNDKNSRVENLELLQGALPLPPAKTTSETEGMIDSSLGGNVKKSTLTNVHEPADTSSVHAKAGIPRLSFSFQKSGSSSGKIQKIDTPETFTSNVDGSDLIGKGEDCILNSVTSVNENQEPMYEGELIRNFLKNNASQLTFYGLFCLQDGIKECELCVFFRNNHFSTMFKYDGELYLLATDQGYINQPDLVWEKLNEVNGDTLFMTGNFKEFQVDGHPNETWDEHTAVTHTADYLAGIDNTAQAGLDLNADLQLAIALQQQEFEQQQPHSRQHNDQQPSSGGGSRLMTRDQAPRSSGRNTPSSPHKAKSNDKCVVM